MTETETEELWTIVRAEIEQFKAENEKLKAEVARLREILADLGWPSRTVVDRCAMCGTERNNDHTLDCPFKAALETSP